MEAIKAIHMATINCDSNWGTSLSMQFTKVNNSIVRISFAPIVGESSDEQQGHVSCLDTPPQDKINAHINDDLPVKTS
eukprot:scaffold530695_cov31-Prasinocladus_malaysianus.AAC.1